MKRLPGRAATLLVGCLFLACGAARSEEVPDKNLVLFDGKQAVARIVAPAHPSVLENLAVEKLTRTARDVFGFDLPVVPAGKDIKTAGALVIGKLSTSAVLKAVESSLRPALAPLGSEGFLVQTIKGPSGSYLALASSGDRGVFNAAVYLADFGMQARKGKISVSTTAVARHSPIAQRGTYNLVCWAKAPRYTLADWEKIVDAMAEDGMNVIYFWVAGLFRSEEFPESFIYPETPLTTDDIRQLIRYAHSRGVDFYLGTGVFAWFGVDEIAKQRPELRGQGIQYMSRTLPSARKAMKSYLFELYDTFPEAKGMWLEIGDEGDYACKEPACLEPLDEFGSKRSGQLSPSFLKEFSAELWQKHPDAKLVWGIGYPEAHKWDVKYYDELRRNFRDPRISFLEVRQNWELQDHEGVLKPLRDLSPNTMHWDQYYGLSLRSIGEQARRVRQDELAGYIVAFEPGFSTNSMYGGAVPFPVDLIPYRLTRFAYREFTWDPNLEWKELKRRLLDHFFGSEADPELIDLTLSVFEFIRTGPIKGYFTEIEHPVDGREYGRMMKPRLAAIEGRLDRLEPSLGPRAKTIGLPLLRRAITDMRTAYKIE